jgi:hypothetical protein
MWGHFCAVSAAVIPATVSVRRGIVGRIITAIIVTGRISPPDRIVVHVTIPITISIDRMSTVEPGIIVRRIIIVEAVRVPRIILISELATGRIEVLLIIVGLFVRSILVLRSTKLRVAPAKDQHGAQEQERNQHSYQILHHTDLQWSNSAANEQSTISVPENEFGEREEVGHSALFCQKLTRALCCFMDKRAAPRSLLRTPKRG